MKAPDWKITGAAGLVIGLTISGLSMVSRSGMDLAVQTIELQESEAAATPGPILVVVGGPATQAPGGGVAATPTPSVEPAPRSTPAVVTPLVVSERPKATPRPKPKATPRPAPAADDPDDCADDDCPDDDHDPPDPPDAGD